MKNLPLWTKTLVVVSITAFGAVACEDGAEVGEVGAVEEQDEGFYGGEEETVGINGEQEENEGLYGEEEETVGLNGEQEENGDFYAQEGQDEDSPIPQDSGINDYETDLQDENEVASQEGESELYGDTGGGQGAESEEEILDEAEVEPIGDESVAQGN
jgi:hypothetical protein